MRDNSNGTDKFSTPEIIENLVFHDKDLAYLTDGWGDVLLFLHGPKKQESNNNDDEFERMVMHLHRITNIQEVLFEDFMTDRTELIPTPAFLNVAAQIRKEGYDFSGNIFKVQVSSRVRLMEDRLLWSSNKEFVKEIKNRIKNRGAIFQCDEDVKSSKGCNPRCPGDTCPDHIPPTYSLSRCKEYHTFQNSRKTGFSNSFYPDE